MKAKTRNLGMLVLISLVIIGLYIESCQKNQRNPPQDQNNLQSPPATKDTLTWRDSLEDVQAQVANEKGTHCLISTKSKTKHRVLLGGASLPMHSKIKKCPQFPRGTFFFHLRGRAPDYCCKK